MIIRRIGSNRESFKAVRFRRGASVILAERPAGPAKKGARSGPGSSTLLAILAYCLGGDRTGPLEGPRLKGWTFSLDAEHGGRPFSVSRGVDEPDVVELAGAGAGGPWPAGGGAAAAAGAARISIDEYRRMLGRIMFGLDPDATPRQQAHHPTLGSLASYCIRQGGRSGGASGASGASGGGYRSPFQSRRAQPPLDVQVSNAYLLGLDWRLAAELADARDRKRRLKALEKEATDGMLADAIGSAGELEAVVIRLEDELQREGDAIKAFKVHERYAELEEEADGLTRAMHDLANERSVQAKTLEGYRQGTRQESDASAGHVLAIYEESGVVFPGSVRRRLEEARRFHESIVRNRREFLESEMGRLEEEVQAKGLQIDAMGEKKAAIMRVLETHGAIEDLVELQARHKETAEKRADASSRLGALEKIGREGAALDRTMVHLRERAGSDFEVHKDQRRRAILAFNRYSETVCGAPGRLLIDMAEGAYRFGAGIEAPGGDRRDIGKMKVFCYDLALASLWAGRPNSPGFLAHDSEIFDGVDGRQVALALQAAARESERLGVQYMCAIDSDAVPHGEFDRGFDFDSHVVARLADGGDDGSLLGIRF